MKYAVLCLALLLPGLYSCSGSKAILVDASSLQTPVQKIHLLSGHKRLHILEGEGERTIPLKHVAWIKISPKSVRNKDGKTFFLMEAELRDGTKIMSYRLKDGRRSQAFVCVDDTLLAQTANGPISIKLSEISKITFE